jgi:hypothetical protein
MKRIGRLSLSAALVVLVAATATHANQIMWSQLPDMTPTGFDYSSQHVLPGTADGATVVADDFVCNDPRPIETLNWWGSFWQGPYAGTFSNYWDDPSFAGGGAPVEPPILTGFTVTFYSAIPIGVDPAMPHGHPGGVVHSEFIAIAAVTSSLEGVIDRTGDAVIGNSGDEAVWQYQASFAVPVQLAPGSPYWISIQAETAVGHPIQWGWHNADSLTGNNAVQGGPSNAWGPAYDTEWLLLPDLDMAFEYEVVVPEPFTLGLMGVGLGMMLVRRKFRR